MYPSDSVLSESEECSPPEVLIGFVSNLGLVKRVKNDTHSAWSSLFWLEIDVSRRCFWRRTVVDGVVENGEYRRRWRRIRSNANRAQLRVSRNIVVVVRC